MLDNKNIEKYFNNMEKRVLALQEHVMGRSAEIFSDKVRNNAKNQREDYSDDVSVSSVKGVDSMFIVHISAQEKMLSDASSPSVFFYVPISPYSVDSELTAALISAQPYVRDFIPYDPAGYYKLVYRKMSPEEWEVVQERNIAETVSLVDKLIVAGADPTKMVEPGNAPDKTPVVEDVVWRVIRQELGIREQRKQVWTPAVKDFKRKKILREVIKDSELDRILIDSNWQDIYKADSEVDETYVQKFEKFQKYILGV